MKKLALAAPVVALLVTMVAPQIRAEEPPADSIAPPPREASPAPGIDILGMINQATVEQRARMGRLLANKYPTLTADLFNLLATQHPEALGEITGYVEHLVKTRYREIPELVLAKLRTAPAVQPAIEKLINEKYPGLVTDLMEMADQGDLQTSVAKLIQEKYPEVIKDVLQAMTSKFASLLMSLQYEVISKHPQILSDVARMVQERYPGFTNDVLILVLTQYPDLPLELIGILNNAPSTEPTAASAEAGEVENAGALTAAESAPVEGVDEPAASADNESDEGQ